MSEIDFGKMLSLYGRWEIDAAKTARFQASKNENKLLGAPSHGFALLNHAIDDGSIECDIELVSTNANSGAFVVFRANGQSRYVAAGLGGWDGAYTLLEGHNLTTTRIFSAGSISNLVAQRKYRVRVTLDGQRVQIAVDGVRVIDFDRLPSTSGTGIGLLAFRGSEEVVFGPMSTDDRRPNAFVAMQFSDPYNEVYRDALRPLIEEIGYDPIRVDEVSQPGIILKDIWNHLTESSVVIAEVSEPNPNVYYEIGVAHALEKPTVLLAQRGTKLPFDLGPHRCIFYENTIAGRAKLQDALRASLRSVLGVPTKMTA